MRSAVLAAAFPNLGLDSWGVAFAFGLTVLTMAYAIATFGMPLKPGRIRGLAVDAFCLGDVLPYIVAQVLGAVAGAGVLYVIASGRVGFDLTGGFASNGYGAHSPGGYSAEAAFVAEAVLTFMFLMIIQGATDRRTPQGFAPIAIGLGLTLIHLISIPVTNTSVNPARSTGPAILWADGVYAALDVLGCADPGAAVAGVVYPWLAGRTGSSGSGSLPLAQEHDDESGSNPGADVWAERNRGCE